MKNFIVLFFVTLTVSSCNDDFLERYPLDQVSPQAYFNTEAELRTYTNGLYTYLPGSDNFMDDNQSDNVATKTYNPIVAGQQTVATDADDAGWTWDYLRNVNFFLDSYQKAQEPQEVKDNYAGIARFYRAWFYFDKVKRFGDVPWYSDALGVENTELYKARDPRVLVMDSVLADLDFAIDHITDPASVETISRWTALALKARVCLHEGTFRKYHGIEGSQRFLQEAESAAQTLIDDASYALYTTGDPQQDYLQLFVADEANTTEFILTRTYAYDLEVRHTANGTFITPTLSAPGLTKSLINTYLMRDGTPFTALPGYDTATFYTETQNRDPRLSQTIRTPGYTRIGENTPLVPDFDNARTGYQCIKFVMGTGYDGYNTNVNDLPIFRWAEVLLNFAEAKAEIGTLTQGDLDQSINLIRSRVGMPAMQLSTLAVDPVLAQRYPNVSGPQQAAILEIRRERRVELAMEGFRYQDLMRWKVGPLLTETFEGMYFPNTGIFDLDKNGSLDVAVVEETPTAQQAGIEYLRLGDVFVLSDGNQGHVIPHPDVQKVFDDPKNYYFPLPRTELLLNEQLTQNPGWGE